MVSTVLIETYPPYLRQIIAKVTEIVTGFDLTEAAIANAAASQVVLARNHRKTR